MRVSDMGIVMLDNKVLMSGNQMALYVPPPIVTKTETWVIKDTAPVDAASRSLSTTNIAFTTNGQSATSIGIDDSSGISLILVYGGIGEVAGFDSGLDHVFEWDNDAYKTLVFDTPPTGDLLTWLQANATKQ